MENVLKYLTLEERLTRALKERVATYTAGKVYHIFSRSWHSEGTTDDPLVAQRARQCGKRVYYY